MISQCIVALVTPFKNGEVDYEALEKLIKFQIKEGIDAIVICGSTGEGLLLSYDERAKIIRSSLEIAENKLPIIVGCSSCSTADAVMLTKQAEKLKADGILLIAPYYVKPTQSGIIEHFKVVHNETHIPILMYNNPGRCAVDMSVETIVALSKLPRITALKDSNTTLSRVNHIKLKSPDLQLLSGDDASLIGYLAHGGNGCISVTANIYPALVKSLITSFDNGNVKTAQNIANQLAHINDLMFCEPNPIPVKYVLHKMGLIQNELRLPLTPASKETEAKLAELC